MKIDATELVRVPKNRIGVVIGVGGKVRKQLEDVTKTKIVIDSETGEVEIFSTPEMDDPVLLWKARDIVKAMGRGFSPERAFKLLDDAYYFEVIPLKQYVGERPNQLRRVKARIIGKEGRTREMIEKFTNCHIVIAGNTVSIIGEYLNLKVAKEAILMLIKGAKHSQVYRFLEEEKEHMNAPGIKLWYRRSGSAEDDLDIEDEGEGATEEQSEEYGEENEGTDEEKTG